MRPGRGKRKHVSIDQKVVAVTTIVAARSMMVDLLYAFNFFQS